jgi:pimeloyl-ACP methyl ester carboxylesterase
MELGFTTYDRLRAEMVTFDARKLGMRFDVPLFFFQGEHDTFSVTPEVQRYADEIDAPIKRVVTIPGGGHSCAFLRNEMLAKLNEHVRPLLRREGP